ncbi:MAG: preprotein translocase subunit YajC [Clostridia bacterium]|nr:preprotein translocase subunit YajC [Clostridia bacterium]
MNFATLLSMASNAGANAEGSQSSGLIMIIFMVFIIGYFAVLMRKDKKQQKNEQDMRDAVKIGDEVLTIGGVVGKVVTVKDEAIDIETGADRTKIRFTRQAIAKNITAEKKAEEIKQAKLAEAKNKAAGKAKK